MYQAIRASAYDLPEDFVSRLEPGLDAAVIASLVTGRQIVTRIRRLWRWVLVLTGLGAAGLFASAFLIRQEPQTVSSSLGFLGLGFLGAASAIFLYVFGAAVAYRTDIHRLEAFAEAMRRSSLARDLG